MDLGLQEKVIIVTGGTKGIGEVISREIAAEGGIPVFIGRTREDGEKLQQELSGEGKNGYFIQADLNAPEACKKIVVKTIEEFGKIDRLVNNAGTNDGIGLEKALLKNSKIL